MQAAAHEFNYQAQGASELLPSRFRPTVSIPVPVLPGRHVRVVVTPGCNVNQLHYHKLLLAYVSVFLRRSEQEVPYKHCEFLDSKVKKESGNTSEAILED